MKVVGVLAGAILLATTGLVACGGGASDEGTTAATEAQPLTIAEVPASAESSAKVGAVVWKVTMVGEAYVTRGYDAQGKAIGEMHIHRTVDNGQVKSLTVATPVEGGKTAVLAVDTKGAVLKNTMDLASAHTVDMLRAIHTDFDAHRHTMAATGDKLAYSRWGCAGAILATIGACGLGGAECVGTVGMGCAFGALACGGTALWAWDSC